jgi:hypothetical protein
VVETDTDVASSSREVNDNPHPPPFQPIANDAYKQLYRCRRSYSKWTSEWGALSAWPSAILGEFEDYQKRGDEKEWRVDMHAKAAQGERVLLELESLFKVLPSDPWQVRDLWTQGFRLAQDFQERIACIRAHVFYQSGP